MGLAFYALSPHTSIRGPSAERTHAEDALELPRAMKQAKQLGSSRIKHIMHHVSKLSLLLNYHYFKCYAIAKSAMGPAPQAVTKKSDLEQNTGCLWHV